MSVNASDRKIYFYCLPPDAPENTGYQHSIICLAEGFKKLGIPYYSNINYWQQSLDHDDYLFRHDPAIQPEDCAVVVVNYEWYELGEKSLPPNLFRPDRQYITVYMDSSDGIKTHSWNPEFRQFDIIFRTHCNRKASYPNNFYPWAFGLSERILQQTADIPRFSDREWQFLLNFRSRRFAHSVRTKVRQDFAPRMAKLMPILNTSDSLKLPPSDPYHNMHWHQTGRRHYPSYYQRLNHSVACACFGGFFVSPFPKEKSLLISRLLKRLIVKLGLKTDTVVQWDSWRLWETLAAGCVAFHIDFEKYGVQLPVMPENWRHYIGVDLDNIDAIINRIASNPSILKQIAAEGREWALEHYSPLPTSQRFLEVVNQKFSEKQGTHWYSKAPVEISV